MRTRRVLLSREKKRLRPRRAKSVLACPIFPLRICKGCEVSSSDLRGKVVLIDFWATWCQPCKKEMPGYQKLLDRYGPQGFVVIGFKFDTMQDTEDPTRFARKIRGALSAGRRV